MIVPYLTTDAGICRSPVKNATSEVRALHLHDRKCKKQQQEPPVRLLRRPIIDIKITSFHACLLRVKAHAASTLSNFAVSSRETYR